MTTSAPAPPADQAEAILQVFRDAPHPLTLAQAQKCYKGPKLSKSDFARTIEAQLLMRGELFKCSPARTQPRYWVQDEEQKVRDAVEDLLAKGPLPEGKLATAVNKLLPKVSSPAAIKAYLQAMHREGVLHEWPGKGKAKSLALRPFDPLAGITFKSATLKDLTEVLAKLEPLGVSVDQFIQVLRDRLRPRRPAAEPPVPERGVPTKARNGEPKEPPSAAGEVEDLILRGMYDLDPAVREGATVLLRDLRRHMPAEYRRHEAFDPAVIRLAEEGRVVLHRHDQPSFLTDTERDELVRDGAGTYFTSIAHRV